MVKADAEITAIRLSDATLSALPASVSRPLYARQELTPGIIHIGLGNFHRAHQAWYIHRLMQAGKARDWAILGAGVRATDSAMRDRLKAQDCLTTLIELDPGGIRAEVTGAMIDYLPVEETNAAIIARMTDPAIRIVSLTVTEGGYYIDPATGGLDTDHPDIVHDAARPDTPRTAFGAVVAALRNRCATGLGPFTVMSCDNLQGNGAVTRRAVVGLARLSDPVLADWIDGAVSFPNSMVDCIVPATGPAEIARARSLGIDDAAPVTHENYRQWVIEDAFCAGRPDFDIVGATLTDNVHAYESMKIRILNAGHQVLANPGEILGIPTIADCMADPLVAAYFRKVELDQIVPQVDAVPGMTGETYLDLIERRFRNPEIRDTTRRVAFDGSSRHPGFVLPILREALAGGANVDGLALVEALWARMCEGTREDGSIIEPNDPAWAGLTATASLARTDPDAWLAQPAIYGALAEKPGFATPFRDWLTLIWADGARAAISRYLSA